MHQLFPQVAMTKKSLDCLILYQKSKEEKTCPVSSVTCHVSAFICHLSPETCHLSPFIFHLSSVTRHRSHITYHLSPVTCHLSPVALTPHYASLAAIKEPRGLMMKLLKEQLQKL